MRIKMSVLGLSLLLATALDASSALASAREYRAQVCLDQALLIPDLVKEIPIPVGCELIDCCPGCPATGPLDWRVRVAGTAIESLAISFEGLPEGKRVAIEGDAELSKTGAVIARSGETSLKNLETRSGDGVPFASLGIRLHHQVMEAMQGADLQGGPGRIEISIDQMYGPFVVNRFLLDFVLRRCRVPFEPCDTVKIQNNQGSDRAVVLLDGERTGGACAADAIYRAASSAAVGNVRSKVECNSELEVFSEENAMEMRAPETSWTDQCGDEVVADLDARLPLPVTVWLVRAGSEVYAETDLAYADEVFNANKTGISFSGTIRDVSDDPAAEDASAACLAIASLDANGFYTAGQINVYYVDVPWPLNWLREALSEQKLFTGITCDYKDRSAVFIYPSANIATLAHEFGHTLSLYGGTAEWAHTNDLPEFTEQNIMWGGGPATRDHLSLGQAFRFNIDKKSNLNLLGVRNGTERSCPADQTTVDPECPPLALDWSRP